MSKKQTLGFEIESDGDDLRFQIDVFNNDEMEWDILKPKRYSTNEMSDILDFLTSTKGYAEIRKRLDEIKDDALSEIAHDKFLESQ